LPLDLNWRESMRAPSKNHPTASTMSTSAFLVPLTPLSSCPTAGRSTLPRDVLNRHPRTAYFSPHAAKSSRPWVVNLALPPPPLSTNSPSTLSYKQICCQAADAVVKFRQKNPEARLLTIDFPPERSENRAGTLVARYENNRNMCEKLLMQLGALPDSWVEVGGNVQICDNINPQGGGEYLTDDEVMAGFRAQCSLLDGRSVTILINAGVDASTLKQVKELDNGRDVVVLINCGLDRMSFLSKLGFAKYIDSFEPVYFLKVFLGTGLLFKWAYEPWQAYANGQTGVQLVQEYSERPAVYKVEELVRIAALNR
jgi:Domain of unknown function (DUF1995)